MDWMEVNGAYLRYEVSGSGHQPLVLIHELGGALESWDEVLPTLEKHFRGATYHEVDAGHFMVVQSLELFLEEALPFLRAS